jgi:predicted RNA-binding Zn-ribbon protein involved in translation (DUF1610 family)
VTTHLASVSPDVAAGQTLLVDGQTVLVLLPRFRGRPSAALVTPSPPCRRCDASLHPLTLELSWRCPQCGDAPPTDVLAKWARRLGTAADGRRGRRGAAGAVAVLLRAAQDGGAPSLTYLLATVTGPERRVLRLVLRDVGDRPLSAERCRAAAAELQALS